MILHLLYAPRTVKGANKIEVIEDCVPLYQVPVTIYGIGKKVKKVYLAPSGEEIPFNGTNSATFMVPQINIHAMIVLDYE